MHWLESVSRFQFFNLSPLSIAKVISVAILLLIFSVSKYGFFNFISSNNGGLLLLKRFPRLHGKSSARIILLCWLFLNLISLFVVFKPVLLIVSILNLAISRYYFVFLRFKSVGRGAGAPGFMIYWLSMAQVLYSICHAFNLSVETVNYLLHFDFALIMLSAGFYKMRTGYLKGRGIEYGLVNPMWSYYPRFFAKFSKQSYLFKINNFLSVYAEILIGLMLLINTTYASFFAAIILSSMFILLLATVRLGTLPLTMLVVALIVGQRTFSDFEDQPRITLLFISFTCFIILGANLWNWLSFVDRLPKLQFFKRILKFCASLTGSIIWSVFSANHTELIVTVVNSREKRNVYSGVALTSLASFRRYYPNSTREWEERCGLYLANCSTPDSHIELTIIHFEGGTPTIRQVESWYLDPITNRAKIIGDSFYSDWAMPISRFSPKQTSGPGSYSS